MGLGLRREPGIGDPSAAVSPRLNHPRSVWLLGVAAAMLHVILALLVLQPAPFSGGDNATYVALARSIVERGDYTSAWDPALTPETLYPPAFPVILAASMAVGADSWIAFKLLLIVISAAGVAVSVVWLARMSTPVVALAGGIIIAISPGVLRHTHLVLSDVPFFTFTMLALWAFTYLDAREERRTDRRWVVLAAFATLLATLTRSAGLPLVLALGGTLLVRRHWRHAAWFAAIAGLPMLAWSIRARILNPNGYASYLLWKDPYQPALGRIEVYELVPRSIDNAARYLFEMFPKLLVSTAGVPRLVAMGLLLVAVAVWLVRLVRRPRVLEFWVLLYSGIILIWPLTWAAERYVIVLLPAIILYAAEALLALTNRHRRFGRALAITAALAVIASEMPGLRAEIRFGRGCRADYAAGDRFACTPGTWKAIMQTADELRGKLPRDAVVLSRKPTLFYVLSGYRSRLYPMSADPDSFFAAAADARADYVLLDDSRDLSELYLQPVLSARPDQFCVIESPRRPGGHLLRIEPAAVRSMQQPRDSADLVRFATCKL